MNIYFKIFLGLLIGINLILCSWFVLHKDIYFQTDIARDFLLLQELDQKKIVLLGPRSSTTGLFHGPLWTYLDFPAYKLGHGDPIVVGWYWIFLISVFLATSFFIAKKLFNELTGYLYVLLLSSFLIFEARGLFNPHGAFFLLPAFFFFFLRVIETQKLPYLLLFFLIAGCIIQFQMAIGIPLLLLASVPIAYTLVKKKKKKFLLSFFILLIPLATFILFEGLHHFPQTKTALSYVFGNNLSTKTYGNIGGLLMNRLNIVFNEGIGIFKEDTSHKNLLLGLGMIWFLREQWKAKRYKNIYLSGLYFYVGYYVLSLVNKSGGMLYHYLMPLYPLVFLVFASFITSKYKKLFIVLFIFVYATNIATAHNYITQSKQFFGNDQNSWKFLSTMAAQVYKGNEKELGYFIYMPDALAYQPKYAMVYASKRSDKKSFYFQKQPIIYLVIAPPPPDKPGMLDGWWKENQLKLNQKPLAVQTFPNGYKIEKYALDEEQRSIPFDPTIDTGLHFR